MDALLIIVCYLIYKILKISPGIFLCSKVVRGLIIEGLSLQMVGNTCICFSILTNEYWKVTTNLCQGNPSERIRELYTQGRGRLWGQHYFNFKFSHLSCKNRYPKQRASLYFFFTTKVSMLISVEGGKALPPPPPNRQTIKFLTFDNLLSRLWHSLKNS